MFSDGEAWSSILLRRSLTASSAICSTGCSTAVMAGCTKVESLVPDCSTVQPYVFGVLVNTYNSLNEVWAQAGMKIKIDAQNSLNIYYLHKSFL